MNPRARGLLLRQVADNFDSGRWGWIQGTYGRTPAGHNVWATNAGARSYCLAGALEVVARDYTRDELRELRRDLADVIGLDDFDGLALERWNDQPGRQLREIVDALALAGGVLTLAARLRS